MAKLYELLAVEPDLRAEANQALRNAIDLFTNGAGRFVGQIVSFKRLLEDEPELDDEELRLATNVERELQGVFHGYGGYLDVTIQKECTNAKTLQTITIGDAEFDMTATALLNLESRLEDLKKVYTKIPTLDPTEIWDYDEGQERYISRPRATIRTKKTSKPVVLYEHTPEHPAQVEMFTEDVPVYRLEKTIFSGALTLRAKNARIGRIDDLIRTVKKARQRANDVEVEFPNISSELYEHING
jgi:hypothetical protein